MPGKRKTTRRDFLAGRSAVEALGELAQGGAAEWRGAEKSPAAGAAAADAARKKTPLRMHLARRAMACQFEVITALGSEADAAEAAMEALDLVAALEDQMTVYRDHSEISRINTTAAHQEVPVEPRLFGLLLRAKELFEETGGAFDITAGPLTKAWGFFRRQGRMPTDAELAEALARVGSRYLELDADRKTVRFTRDGIEINLGAIGKGYALDRCAELLTECGVRNFLLHGGQSSVLARDEGQPVDPPAAESPSTAAAFRSLAGGSAGGSAGAANTPLPHMAAETAAAAESPCPRGWPVGVRHPLRPRQRLAVVRLFNQAMGTSGAATQFFTHGGKRYGHVIDPRTGRPAEGVYSATVLAPDAATADALSTAFFVMGVEASLDFCRRFPELGAILLAPGKRRGSVEVHVAGLASSDWQQLSE